MKDGEFISPYIVDKLLRNPKLPWNLLSTGEEGFRDKWTGA